MDAKNLTHNFIEVEESKISLHLKEYKMFFQYLENKKLELFKKKVDAYTDFILKPLQMIYE